MGLLFPSSWQKLFTWNKFEVLNFWDGSINDLGDQNLPIEEGPQHALFMTLALCICKAPEAAAWLGIDGLAFAAATQDKVKNIFGGALIFLNVPFKLNARLRLPINLNILKDSTRRDLNLLCQLKHL